LREIMASLGFRTINEMVGQMHKLNRNKAIAHYKSSGIDISPILFQANEHKNKTKYNTCGQEHNLEEHLDFQIIKQAHQALFRRETTHLNMPINNMNRAVGAILSNEISKIYGAQGLPENTININFNGSAGQSFGAFATKGVSLVVDGNTNDYLGKGLSGGKIVIRVPKNCDIVAKDNIITGNVSLYGATSGKVFINGQAGERFCVRNSGAMAVVEGIGDHGCEYMTGGVAVILGKFGRNFGAGMSGGIAYILDEQNTIDVNFGGPNLNVLSIENEEDEALLKELIEQHYKETSSKHAESLLENWPQTKAHFKKIFPEEYRQALEKLAQEELKEKEIISV
jgi:glutamate synthase (NADPH/NADH) large chain